jgi:pimeloyl-ACP methyl ester carboxylesterase
VSELVLIEPVIPLLHAPTPQPALVGATLDRYEASLRRVQQPSFRGFDTAVDLVRREYPGLPLAFCQDMARRVVTETDDGYRWIWDPALREFERHAAPFLEADTLRNWIARLKMPVTFVVASASPFPTAVDAEALAQRMPRARIVRVPGTHQAHAESAGLIAQLLTTRSQDADSSNQQLPSGHDLRP